jgi:hypothetical protein
MAYPQVGISSAIPGSNITRARVSDELTQHS